MIALSRNGDTTTSAQIAGKPDQVSVQSNNLHRRYLQRLDQQVDSLQARNREKEHSAQEACNALARKNGSVIGPIRMDGNYRNRGVCIG